MIKRMRSTRYVTSDSKTWATRDEAYAHEKFLIMYERLESLWGTQLSLDVMTRYVLATEGLLIVLAPQQPQQPSNLQSDSHHD